MHDIVDLVPEEWLKDEPGFADTAALRDAYVEFLSRRLDEPREWVRDLRWFVGKPFEYAVLKVIHASSAGNASTRAWSSIARRMVSLARG